MGKVRNIDLSTEKDTVRTTTGYSAEKQTTKEPELTDTSELKFTLHNEMHGVVGFLRLKEGWTQFATKDEPDHWVYPCPFKWNHHHCDIIDRSDELKRLEEGFRFYLILTTKRNFTSLEILRKIEVFLGKNYGLKKIVENRVISRMERDLEQALQKR